MQTQETKSQIHPTAVIHPSAKIAEGVTIGPFAVIGEDVVLERGVTVGPHAVVEFAEVGEECRIHAGAFVGTPPQDLKYKGEPTKLIMGPRCVVRECATLNRGTEASGKTVIGEQCLFMAYSHVAHDCVIGNRVILANSVAVAGHVEIGDDTVIGGLAGIHQFTRIGRGVMLAGAAAVSLDVPPFCIAHGNRAYLVGLNLVGLKRRGASLETVRALKAAYSALFRSTLTMKEAIPSLRQSPTLPEVEELLRFIETSSRGVTQAGNAADKEDF